MRPSDGLLGSNPFNLVMRIAGSQRASLNFTFRIAINGNEVRASNAQTDQYTSPVSPGRLPVVMYSSTCSRVQLSNSPQSAHSDTSQLAGSTSSGLNWALPIESVCPVSEVTTFPLTASHIRTVVISDPETIRVPFVLNCALFPRPALPIRPIKHCPLAASHTRAV